MKRFDRYSKIPKDVLTDLSLSGDAIRVYAVLAMWVFQGNVARIGMRKLAKDTGLSTATVCRRIQELVRAGHVQAGIVGKGQRAYYVLTSQVFAIKQRVGIEEAISYPHPRLVSTRIA